MTSVRPAEAQQAQPTRACEGPLSPKWTGCVGMHAFAWGHRYEGEWKEGKMHGAGRLFSDKGELIQSGSWIDGVFQAEKEAPPISRRPDAPARINFNACLAPTYPVGARHSGAVGDSDVEYTLGTDGKIKSAQIAISSGTTEAHKLLDLLAVDAVKACTGTPEIKNGVPIELTGRVRYNWKLTDASTAPQGSNPQGVQQSGATTAPVLNFNACEKPEYTTAASRAEARGTVVVFYTMDVEGRITDAVVEQSSGPTREHKQLDRATLEAVKACRGIPAVVNGVKARMSGRVNYVWGGDGAKAPRVPKD
jgi:TonB family protein